MAELKMKLKQIEDDLAQLRTERADKVKARDAAKEAFAAIEGYDTDSAEFKALDGAQKNVGQVDERIAQADTAYKSILGMVAQQDPAAIQRATAKAIEAGDHDAVQALFESAEYSTVKGYANSNGRFGQVRLGEAVSRDAFKADVTGTTGSRRGVAQVFPAVQRPLTVLDFMTVGATNQNVVEYVKMARTYNAVEVTEGSAKPEAGFTFTDASATVRTIAEWAKIQKQSLADVAYLETVVRNSLDYGVRRRLEAQVIGGNGTPPNLQGIIGTSGVGATAYATEPLVDLIHHSILDVVVADLTPNAVVVNPADWETIRLAKDGNENYLYGPPSQAGPLTVWGLPVLVSSAMTAGFALVGDFAQGATLFVRSGVEVLMSDSDQDDFIKNKVTLLAEIRAALTVQRPDAFSVADLAA